MRFNEFKIREAVPPPPEKMSDLPSVGTGTAGHAVVAVASTVVAHDFIKSILKRSIPKLMKDLVGPSGQYLLVWDFITFAFFPANRDAVIKKWKDQDWPGLVLEWLTLRGVGSMLGGTIAKINWVTILAAMVIDISRNIYNDAFEHGTPKELEGLITGDDPWLKGRLEDATLKNNAVVGARISFMSKKIYEIIKEEVGNSIDDMRSAVANRITGKQGAANARNAVRTIDTPGNPSPTLHPERYPK
jgi:hypothetical protein